MQEPDALSAHKALIGESWTPAYENLDKKPVRDALAREQGISNASRSTAGTRAARARCS